MVLTEEITIQGNLGNRDIADRRRNVLDRENNRVNNAETNRSNEQRPQARERRNVFDRNRNNNSPNEQREATTDRPIERRNVFDRNRNNDRPNTQQPADDRRRERPALLTGISNGRRITVKGRIGQLKEETGKCSRMIKEMNEDKYSKEIMLLNNRSAGK